MHTHLVAATVFRYKHGAAAVEPLLRRIAQEQLILVSSGGSDWLEGSGKAEKVEGGFRITARKIFSSGSPSGQLLMTTAIYDDPLVQSLVGEMDTQLAGAQALWRESVVLPQRRAGADVPRHPGRALPSFPGEEAVRPQRPHRAGVGAGLAIRRGSLSALPSRKR
jgi:alkylation response protein AidB-like acyl-CoA dehydrogenase